MARCHCIAGFTFPLPGNSSLHLVSSQTAGQGLLILYCVSSIAVREIPPMAILANFHARHMLDCSTYTQPSRLAIVADMLKSYKILVGTSNNWIAQLPQPSMLLKSPLWRLLPVLTTPENAYYETRL